jgi:hypothetical protein
LLCKVSENCGKSIFDNFVFLELVDDPKTTIAIVNQLNSLQGIVISEDDVEFSEAM